MYLFLENEEAPMIRKRRDATQNGNVPGLVSFYWIFQLKYSVLKKKRSRI